MEYKFIDMDKWNKAVKSPYPTDEELKKHPCTAGLDLSSHDDTTALALCWCIDGVLVFKVWYWLPADNAGKREQDLRVPITRWAKDNHITLTPGDVIDYEFVRKTINDLYDEYLVDVVYVDPYNATNLCSNLIADGITIEYIHQYPRVMNSPLRYFTVNLSKGNIRLPKNPVLNWQASNAIAIPDSYGLLKLDKQKKREAIDGLSAMINALTAQMVNNNIEPSIGFLKDGA